ncbi:hypothetical protein KGF54_005185, partial [Candida jiufengensis]|uniref:uncharacterized protein n=1 Tax=Candida jiufengensis TaxID=497108 RepID=UPI002225539F
YEARYEYVSNIIKSGINYANCVFIDEAGFNINLHRSSGWAEKGKTPVVVTPSTRAVNRSVLGAVCFDGVVKLSLRKPNDTTQNKKRKADGQPGANVAKGTVTAHYKQFLVDIMNVLDDYEQYKNAYLVMDNAPIHTNMSIKRIIEARGYKCLYLPPFSPELNPIEQFWFLLKQHIKREPMSKDTLSLRIKDASNLIPVQHIQNSIQHSINCFQTCLDKKPL